MLQIESKFKCELGKYYIGDPCYIVKDESWDSFCDLLYGEEDHGNLVLNKIKLQDAEILVGNTYYGDGVYYSSYPNLKILVDSGLIGLIKISEMETSIIDSEKLKNHEKNIVEFHHSFECSLNEGVFNFGEYSIDTKNTDDEDYPEEENLDEEDE